MCAVLCVLPAPDLRLPACLCCLPGTQGPPGRKKATPSTSRGPAPRLLVNLTTQTAGSVSNNFWPPLPHPPSHLQASQTHLPPRPPPPSFIQHAIHPSAPPPQHLQLARPPPTSYTHLQLAPHPLPSTPPTTSIPITVLWHHRPTTLPCACRDPLPWCTCVLSRIAVLAASRKMANIPSLHISATFLPCPCHTF